MSEMLLMGEGKQTIRQRKEANLKETLGIGAGASVALPVPAQRKPPKKEEGRQAQESVFAIRLDRIVPDPDQPRKEFNPEELAALASSLRDTGQLQPIRVRWDAAIERWVIISGERRYRAARIAGLETVDCVEVKGALAETDIRRSQLIENCIREDLKPLEQASAFRELMTMNGWTGKELAEALHLPPSAVTQALALLKLPPEVRDMVEGEAISASTAYEIQKLEDPAKQRRLAERVVTEKLTRAQTVEAARRLKGKSRPLARRPTRVQATSGMPIVRTYRLRSNAQVAISGDASRDELDVIEEALERIGATLT